MSTAPPVATDRRDVIDEILGIEPGSPLWALRAQRPDAVEHIQGSYRELFDPEHLGGVTAPERFAIALRVADRHDRADLAAHYRARLTAVAGPDPLAVLADPPPSGLPDRLRAALAHADLLTRAPAAARAADLERLQDAGLTPDVVVVVSQLVAFVSFQTRVVVGLSLIAANPGAPS